jgi:hypothetical protein
MGFFRMPQIGGVVVNETEINKYKKSPAGATLLIEKYRPAGALQST